MKKFEEFLDILACPKCKGDLELVRDPQGFLCKRCSLLYPIKDEIPVMLVEEAIRVSDDEGRDESSR